MTETAAIALMMVDRAPRLAPTAGTEDSAFFHQLLVWLVANVYPTFTYGDYPMRRSPSAPDEVVASTNAHREALYRWLEEQVRGPFALGKNISIIDCYLAAIVNWRPGREWFDAHCPRIAAVAERCRSLEVLAPVITANAWD